jgi:hypothetical protein
MLSSYWFAGRYALGSDDQYLYFPAYFPETGMEPYRLPLEEAAPLGEVVGRQVFYNNSAFDGRDAAANAADDGAIATDKSALLPGQATTAANVTNAFGGINGVMIDLSGGLPMTALAGIAASLGLEVGAGAAAGWAAAPGPTQIGIRPGAGVGGSDRITLTWPDGAIRNAWLRVTVHASPASGLARDDVFSFANLIGDADGNLRVNALDLAAVKRALNSTAPVTSATDITRDGRVNALDLAAVKQNLSRSLQPVAWPAAAVGADGAPALLDSITRSVLGR